MAEHDSTLKSGARNEGSGPDLVALWQELEAGWAEHGANDLEPEDDSAWKRYRDAHDQIEAARPTDLRGLAVQASLIGHNLEIGHRDEQIPMVRHIAEQLEALASAAF
jgi:hypothetical protein